MSFQLERLDAGHPVASFCSGDHADGAAIDLFLREQAAVEQAAGWSATTVAIDRQAANASDLIVGFFTLSPLSLRADPAVLRALGVGAAYPQAGGYLLGRLGVAVQWQGQGLGRLLLERAIDAACHARVQTGGVFLAIDAKNERLVAWYLGLGFGLVRLSADRPRLVMRLP